MKIKIRLLVVGVTVLSLLPFPYATGQTKRSYVTLSVKHNGALLPSPKRVMLVFDSHSLSLTLQRGRFEVPRAALTKKNIHLLARVGDEQIRISGIYGSALRQDQWTLILADQTYDADNQWIVPKGASVRSSCILTFESSTAEGTLLFQPHCRYPLPPSGQDRRP